MNAIVPQRITPEELGRLLNLLDVSEAFDKIVVQRWMLAAEDGEWTPDEVEAAVRWLNLNRTGYIRIAHVHEQVLRQRNLLKLAKMFCWRHPVAKQFVADAFEQTPTPVEMERHWQDNRWEWVKSGGIAERVMAALPDAEWRRWAEKNADSFRSER
jgi:hypothetical protein